MANTPPPSSLKPSAPNSDMPGNMPDVVIGGQGSCVTVTGLKVASTRDALTIFEACRRNILPRITRRLTEIEKAQINDGTVVVFDEKEAKMKRWTDGRLWTPSRIMGNFLVYREVDRKLQPNREAAVELDRWDRQGAPSSSAFSSHKGVFFPTIRGLMKKTISLNVPDNEQAFLAQHMPRPPRMHQQHLIAYFRAETSAMLPGPDDMEELQDLKVPFNMLRIQKFRRPLSVDIIDGNDYEILASEKEDSDELPPTQPESVQPPERYTVAAVEPLAGDQPAMQVLTMTDSGSAVAPAPYFQMADSPFPFLQAMDDSSHFLGIPLSAVYADTLVHPMSLEISGQPGQEFAANTICPQDSLQRADAGVRTDDDGGSEHE